MIVLASLQIEFLIIVLCSSFLRGSRSLYTIDHQQQIFLSPVDLMYTHPKFLSVLRLFTACVSYCIILNKYMKFIILIIIQLGRCPAKSPFWSFNFITIKLYVTQSNISSQRFYIFFSNFVHLFTHQFSLCKPILVLQIFSMPW